MIFVIIAPYLVGSAVTGLKGRRTVIGFTGRFVLSVVPTPFLDFLIQVVSVRTVPGSA